jgi:TonB family protein
MKRSIIYRVNCALISGIFFSVITSGNAKAPDAGHAKHDVALYAPPPKYPFAARARHLTGSGVFSCNVRPDGTVASVDVLKSTGHESLDDAAIAAFRRWKFKPGQLHVIRIPMAFTIHGVQRSGGPASSY